jgi:hypothetical protein
MSCKQPVHVLTYYYVNKETGEVEQILRLLGSLLSRGEGGEELGQARTKR